MTTFETLAKRELEFGNNRFLEVAHKRWKDETSSDSFYAITLGYLDSQGSKRYKTNLALPTDDDVVAFTIEALADIADLEDWDVPEEATTEVA